MKEFEDPAGLLGDRGDDEEITQRAAQQRQHTGNAGHDLPFLFGRLSITRNRSRHRRRCPVKMAAAQSSIIFAQLRSSRVSQLTRRCREMDSNLQYRGTKAADFRSIPSIEGSSCTGEGDVAQSG
jgi:hypothetical protein